MHLSGLHRHALPKTMHSMLLTGWLVLLAFVSAPRSVAQQPAGVAGQPPTDASESANQTLLESFDGREGRELMLRNFRPRTNLIVPRTTIDGATYPVVDVHTHMFGRQRHNEQALDDFVDLMDRRNIAVCVSLDGKLGSQLEEHIAFLDAKYMNRFVVFAHLDWVGDGDQDLPATWACNRPGWAERSARQLVEAKQLGACGLKIFKNLGLKYRDRAGKLIPIDSTMLDPIWNVCGELGLPVLIHTADPVSFFQPLGPENERWEELSRHPDWHFYGKDFPARDALLAARNRVIARHPKTTFIGAHMASSSEDLAQLAEWLETYPNLYVDPASRISELGRQPFTTRKFLIEHSDRVLFGTDGPWPEQRVEHYWRFMQTHDEYFPYSEKPFPPQGFWQIYGVKLPPDVLRAVYFENAARIIPGVAERVRLFRNRVQEPGKARQ